MKDFNKLESVSLYLYGSQASGRATPTGDVDLLYFTNQKARVDIESETPQICEILGMKKVSDLDVKIYYLWQPRATLIFPYTPEFFIDPLQSQFFNKRSWSWQRPSLKEELSLKKNAAIVASPAALR